jgi:hypothetical protein
MKIVLEVIAVAVGCAYTLAAYQQLGVMRQQYGEMQLARQQTARDNAAAIAAQQVIAQQGLTASQQASDKSFAATVAQFHLEQRAWVAASESMSAIEPGKPIPFAISAVNTGKTFAKKVIIKSLASFSLKELTEAELTEAPKPEAYSKITSVAVLAPNFPAESKQSVPVKYVDRILERLGSAGYTYLWGEITYEDIFGQKHVTKYCGYRAAASSDVTFLQCRFHNDAD